MQHLPPFPPPTSGASFLHLSGDRGELRVAKKFDKRIFLLAPFLVIGFGLALAGSLWLATAVSTLPASLAAWALIVAGPAIFFWGVWDFGCKRRTPDEWVVNAHLSRLEHNGAVVARFEEMRAVWVRSEADRNGWEHTIFVTVHQGQTFRDIAIDRVMAARDDQGEFVHAAQHIARASEVLYEERQK